MAGIALIVVVSFASGCATTATLATLIRQHPDFANAARKVETIAILPPDVEHVRIVFNGDNQRLTERERAIAKRLYQGFEKALKSKEYVVRPSLAKQEEEAGKNVSFELQQLRMAYDQAAKQLYEKPASEEESKSYRVSVGPVVNPIADLSNADALLYVRYYGYEKSGGQQAKEIVASTLFALLTGIVAVPLSEGAALEVALIHGATGDVLWVNRGSSAGPGKLGLEAVTMAEGITIPLPARTTAVAESDEETAPALGSATPASAGQE